MSERAARLTWAGCGQNTALVMADPPLQDRKPGFARLASGILWALAIAFLLGAAQVGRAMWSGRLWMNYRGELVTATELRRELAFFVMAALVCGLLAGFWHRSWRRRS